MKAMPHPHLALGPLTAVSLGLLGVVAAVARRLPWPSEALRPAVREGRSSPVAVLDEAPSLRLDPAGGPCLRVPAGFRAVLGTVAEPYTGTGWATEIAHEATGLEMVYCPAGSFTMGSPATDADRDLDEPAYAVTLFAGFYMGSCEVTQGQWQHVMGSNPSMSPEAGAEAPVESISWEDCQEFCRMAGYGLRLPTEVEWEYACRAGSATAFAFGSDAALLCRYGNYCDRANTQDLGWRDAEHGDGFDRVAPVGSLVPNAWGLHDMHGNVWEWCLDVYDGDGEILPPGSEADAREAVVRRVLRGGSWLNSAWALRSANRLGCVAEARRRFIGFRVCLVPEVGVSGEAGGPREP